MYFFHLFIVTGIMKGPNSAKQPASGPKLSSLVRLVRVGSRYDSGKREQAQPVLHGAENEKVRLCFLFSKFCAAHHFCLDQCVDPRKCLHF